jgi:hypothetical protein
VTDVEPHVVVLRGVRPCAECGSREFFVVAVPKIATGELFPVHGLCESCGYTVDLWGSGPLDVRPCLVCGAPVECDPDFPAGVRVTCQSCVPTR